MLDIVNKLNILRGTCLSHIEATEAAQQQQKSFMERQKQIIDQIAKLNEIRAYVKRSIKVCSDYLAERRLIANTDLKLAIKSASSVVAGCPPLKYIVKDNYAVILAGPEGRESPVNMIEGGGLRCSISFFIRSATLQNTVYMPFVLLDEAFAVMSSETSEAASHLLREVANHFQLIVIEQKPEVTAAGVAASFKINKVNGYSTATRMV